MTADRPTGIDQFEQTLRDILRAQADVPMPEHLAVGLDETLRTTPPALEPRWRLATATGLLRATFGVTRFVAAAVIVALFGGFLLAGMLTRSGDDDLSAAGASASPTPTSYADPLADLELSLEEISPGIFRFRDDGAGLSASYMDHSVRLATTATGEPILSTSDGYPPGGQLQIVGPREPIAVPSIGRDGYRELASGADGAVWMVGWSGVASYVDGEWHETAGVPRAFDTLPDGRGLVLMQSSQPPSTDGPVIVSVDPISGSESSIPYPTHILGRLERTERPSDVAKAQGALWVGVQDDSAFGLARLDDGADPSEGWVRSEPLGAGIPFGTHALAVGPDDTLWALLLVKSDGKVPGSATGTPASPFCCEPVLARLRDGAWTSWTKADGLPFSDSVVWSYPGHWLAMTVASDGMLWMGGWPGPVSFDGTTFQTYGDRIAGTGNPATAGGLAITPDGLVWVLVSTVDGGRDDDSVYIITPEATTAASLDAATPLIVDDPAEADADTPDRLPGGDLVIEEVGPGVQRLTADGFGRSLRGLLAVERAGAGHMWLLNRDGDRVFRLDTSGATKIDVRQQRPLVSSMSDGSLVMVAGRDAYLVAPTVSDARDAPAPAVTSIAPALPSHVRTPTALAGADDGSVWASWTQGNSMNAGDTRVLRYLDGEWQDLSGTDGLGGLIDLESTGNYVCDITDTTDGAVYVGVCGAGGGGFGDGGLFRFLDGTWERMAVFAEIGRPDILVSDLLSLASGPDGTLWAVTWTTTPRIAESVAAGDWSAVEEETPGPDPLQHGPALLRLQDGRWSAYAWWTDIEPDTQRVPWELGEASDALAVDADGVLWFGSVEMNRSKVKFGSYDGEELHWYPEVAGARDLDIGPDGRPWVTAVDGINVIDLAEAQRDLDGPGPE